MQKGLSIQCRYEYTLVCTPHNIAVDRHKNESAPRLPLARYYKKLSYTAETVRVDLINHSLYCEESRLSGLHFVLHESWVFSEFD